MNTTRFLFAATFTCLLLLASCSRKKNTFLSRGVHAVVGEYNKLYNGENALESGREGIISTYRDNYWEILPIERFKEAPAGAGEAVSPDPNFEKAEEKAAKAIQKHAIFIDGKEYNPQTDEAYMLLGKSRYYNQRFIQALDAFNFILTRYPTSNSINEAKVWKAKTNIRLRNEEGALRDLEKALEYDDLKPDQQAQVAAIMAQAYINLDTLEAALPLLKIASTQIKDNELKGRYSYIKGQVYTRLGHKDSANMAFEEVIALNRKTPRIYMINAYIEKANNFDYEEGDNTQLLEVLNTLLDNRENRPYQDKILHQKGVYFLTIGKEDSAMLNFNKSLRKFNGDRILQAENYSRIAKMYFDNSEYILAGKYYDSTYSFLDPKTKRGRLVKKKKENLEELLRYEALSKRDDSILKIATLSEAEQLAYFTNYTETLKAKAKEDSLAKVKEAETIANNEFYKKKTEKAKQSGPFYFYNPTTVSYGKQEFRKIWGDRKLEDNWRISSTFSSLEEENIPVEATVAASDKFKPETYLKLVPKGEKALDSITKERNFAYYQLGLLYKEKFQEYLLAKDKLETLVTFKPEDRLQVAALYNLYKVQLLLEEAQAAEATRNTILTDFSETRYAQILENPNQELAQDKSSPEYKYQEVYALFESQAYSEVISQCETYINLYTGEPIVAKFELLKATAIGKRDGFNAYKTALNFVMLNYPNSEEGKQAQKTYSKLLPLLTNARFVSDTTQNQKWKQMFVFPIEDQEKAQALKNTLDNALDFFEETDYHTSIDYYNDNTLLVLIHGLPSFYSGQTLLERLKNHKDYRVKEAHYGISSKNYTIVQVHKNLETYLTQYTLN